MSDLSFMLTRALDRGRAGRGVPASRAQVLRALLRKRAEAHRQGLGAQEKLLRDQIRWALPMLDDAETESGEPA
jgi:hypothetical protein